MISSSVSAPTPPAGKPALSGNVKATCDDWRELALRVLAAEGVAHVTVLDLSQRLGVSRSSFYWYFKNRDDLLDALLTRWEELNTRSIVAQAGAPAASIGEAVCNVFRCWVNPEIFSPRLDFAVP
jgi:AcrR family transcriptional regulator